jgi:hypothetical protein
MQTPEEPDTAQAAFVDRDDADLAVARLADDQVQVYQRQSRELVSHANREESAILGYRGRQILELLQNADDAADDGSDQGRLLIFASNSHVVVANTGIPFSRRGLESLVISDCSPKQLERNRFIGCKGLGFRSVLTWTRRPLIASGHLRVAFSHPHALSRIDAMAAASPDLERTVQEFRGAEGHAPVPLMRFPFVPPADDSDLQLAEEWLARGFTTVVVLPFGEDSRGRVSAEVRDLLRHLTTETILFCRHLTEVEIQTDTEQKWEILREPLGHDRTRVIVHDSTVDRLWTVHRREGRLALEPGHDGQRNDRDYETAIAVPERPTRSSERMLCVFFPTQDAAPLPVVLHATLELGDDRNRVRDTAANRSVLGKLAQHLADVVSSSADSESPKRAIRLLDGLPDVDPELLRLGFVDAVVAQARTQAIFPRITGELGSADQVLRAPHDSWRALLSPDHFPEVLDVRFEDGLTDLLNLFEVGWYEQDELQKRLKAQVSSMQPEDAGRMVGRLAASDRLRWSCIGELLMGQSGELLTEDKQCFFTPTTALGAVPGWAQDIRFLHEDFQRGLLEGAKAQTVRGLVSVLQTRGANVDEYRLETVTRALLVHVNQVSDHERSDRVRGLLRWLFDGSKGELPALGQIRIPVLDASGSVCRPDECYLGWPYPGGALAAALYGCLSGVAFVAGPEELGLGGLNMQAIEGFLCGLGVSRSPRGKPLVGGLHQFSRTVLEVVSQI